MHIHHACLTPGQPFKVEQLGVYMTSISVACSEDRFIEEILRPTRPFIPPYHSLSLSLTSTSHSIQTSIQALQQ